MIEEKKITFLRYFNTTAVNITIIDIDRVSECAGERASECAGGRMSVCVCRRVVNVRVSRRVVSERVCRRVVSE